MSLGRPAMRKGEERKIKASIALHDKIMREYIQAGWTLEQASKKALQDMLKGRKS
jgi:hypothetical protein